MLVNSIVEPKKACSQVVLVNPGLSSQRCSSPRCYPTRSAPFHAMMHWRRTLTRTRRSTCWDRDYNLWD